MVGTAELVLLAIQAGVKLAKAGRTVYVEETIRQEVAFPLPPTLSSPRAAAEAAMLEASRGAPGSRELLAFDTVFEPVILNGTDEEILAVYLEYTHRGVVKPLGLAARERAGLAMISQWESSKDPLPSPLQRVAGTLVGIAVDYFANVPGTISTDTKYGKTLLSFLKGIDDVRFDEARWDSIVVALFSAGLDAVQANPDLFSDDDGGGDDSTANIVRTAVGGIASDLAERLKQLEGPDAFDAEDRLKRFGSLVLRGVLEGAGRSLISNPEVLGVSDSSDRALVTGVGSAFLDLLLDDSDAGVDLAAGLRRVASTDGLSALMHASLRVVAQHPDLISTGSTPVNAWLKSVVTGLYELYPEPQDLFDAELLSNTAYLVLHHGINDLNGLVLKGLPAGQASLAVTVASGVLGAVVKPPSGNTPAKWDFDLSRDELLGLVSGALGAVAARPEWVFEKPSHRKIASTSLPLIVDVIAHLGSSNGAWLKSLVRSDHLQPVLSAVLSSGLLDRFRPDGNTPIDAEALAVAITKVLRATMGHGVANTALLLDYALLHDVLSAVKRSGLLDTLLGGSTSEAKKAAEAIAGVLAELRTGAVLTIPTMTERLKG